MENERMNIQDVGSELLKRGGVADLANWVNLRQDSHFPWHCEAEWPGDWWIPADKAEAHIVAWLAIPNNTYRGRQEHRENTLNKSVVQSRYRLEKKAKSELSQSAYEEQQELWKQENDLSDKIAATYSRHSTVSEGEDSVQERNQLTYALSVLRDTMTKINKDVDHPAGVSERVDQLLLAELETEQTETQTMLKNASNSLMREQLQYSLDWYGVTIPDLRSRIEQDT